MPSKRCFKCLCEKPFEGFYKHPRMADGHLNKCIDCTKADVMRNRQERVEKYREYDRARATTEKRRQRHREYMTTPEGKAAQKRSAERWQNKHPQRRAAQVALGNAVRDGRLKSQPCFLCGADAEAHHPDYSRPLDVVWLCPAHHKQAHALGNQLLKGNHQ